MTFSSTVTKPQLQGLLLAQIKKAITDETKVLQLKLQLIQAEKVARAEAQAARDVDEQTFRRKLQLEEQARSAAREAKEQARETDEHAIQRRLQLEETARERHRQAEARWDQANREAEERARDDARREREREHEREMERQRELQHQAAEAARVFREAGTGDQVDLGGQG